MTKIATFWVVAPIDDAVCSNCNWFKPETDMSNRKGTCALAAAPTAWNDTCEVFKSLESQVADTMEYPFKRLIELDEYVEEQLEIAKQKQIELDRIMDDNDW